MIEIYFNRRLQIRKPKLGRSESEEKEKCTARSLFRTDPNKFEAEDLNELQTKKMQATKLASESNIKHFFPNLSLSGHNFRSVSKEFETFSLEESDTSILSPEDNGLKYGHVIKLSTPQFADTNNEISVSNVKEINKEHCMFVGKMDERKGLLSLGKNDKSFKELNFQLIHPNGKKMAGSAVHYGDAISLIDQYGNIMTRSIQNDGDLVYISISKEAENEVIIEMIPWIEPDLETKTISAYKSWRNIALKSPSDKFSSEKQPIKFGDNVQLKVCESFTEVSDEPSNITQTSYKQEKYIGFSMQKERYYLRCHSTKGKFSIQRGKAFIRSVTISEPINSKERRPLIKQKIYHNLTWKTPISFEISDLQIQKFLDSANPVVTIKLTDSGFLNMTMNDILNNQGTAVFALKGKREAESIKVKIEEIQQIYETKTDSAKKTIQINLGAKMFLWPLAILLAAYSYLDLNHFGKQYNGLMLLAAILFSLLVHSYKKFKNRSNLNYSNAPKKMLKVTPLGLEDLDTTDLSSISLNTVFEDDDSSEGYGHGNYLQNVLPGSPPMPRRFLIAEKGDLKKAIARWQHTLLWRKEMNLDSILLKSHGHFNLIKKYYKHFFHYPDKKRNMVYYEMPGKSNMEQLKAEGVDRENLLWHYCYCMEYLWEKLQPKETDRLTIVIDCEGIGIKDLRGEMVEFLKITVSTLSTHYPQRSYKIIVLNSPSVSNIIFKLFKPLLNESTRSKINFVPNSQIAAEMIQVIPPENLPAQYGGSCSVPLGEAPAEQCLQSYVMAHLTN
mmetsp:Transcript_14346/g.21260  ORF Transcript_14346/g.21260 Transcript_14346/m.21260 type:complete len:785 (+) Transcript_14346:256-2610(+)